MRSLFEVRTKWLATLVRVAAALLAVFLRQTLYHYALLSRYYGGDYTYLDVLTAEWNIAAIARLEDSFLSSTFFLNY